MEQAPKTPRGDEYRQRALKSREGKLYNPRNIEGEPNWEMFEVAKRLESALGKYSWFIGLTLYGSKMMGYSNEKSDTDIGIFYDSDETPPGQVLKDIAKERADLGLDEARSGFDTLLSHEMKIYDLSLGRMKYLIRGEDGLGYMTFSLFCGPAIGQRVQEYRKMLGEEIKKLPDEKRKQFIRELGGMLSSLDRASYSTREKRKLPVSSQFPEIVKPRLDLWERRALKVLGLQEYI